MTNGSMNGSTAGGGGSGVVVSDDASCLTDNRNYTDIYRQDYGGVHLTFALNAALTILILIIFSFMRKGIGSYARLGVTLKKSKHVLPNIVHTVTTTANNAATRISEAGHKLRHSRIVSGNFQNYEINGATELDSNGGRGDKIAADLNDKNTTVPRMRSKSSLPLGVTSLRRSTITLGAEEGDEFATLPQSEVVDLGDIQLDHPPSNSQATALHYANNNNEGEEKHLQDGSRGHGDVILLSRNEGDVGDNMNTMSASTSYAPGVKIISATGNDDEVELEKRRMRIAEEDEQHLFSWLRLTLTLSIADFGHKVNQDCVQYLHFQRHVIGFMLLNTIVCMLVLLPINLVCGNQFNHTNHTKSFGRLTLNNLEPGSNLLVVHSIYAFVVCVLILSIMSRFENKYVNKDPSTQTTVLVKNFPISRALFESGIKGKPHLLISRLETYFVRVLKILPSNFQIYLTFDVSDLEKLVKKYNKFTECIDYVVRKNAKEKNRRSLTDSNLELNSLTRRKPPEPELREEDPTRDIIDFDQVIVTVENHEEPSERRASLDDKIVEGEDKDSPSPSEIVEKSYVMNTREFAARQNSASKRLKWRSHENDYINLQPVSKYLSDDVTIVDSDVATAAETNNRVTLNINGEDEDLQIAGPSTSSSSSHCTYNRRPSQSPKVAIKKASMKIRDSMHLNQLHLEFNRCCVFCPCGRETRNAFEYYSEKRNEVVEKIVKLVHTRPFEQRLLPMFFLTLPSKKVADTICNFLPYEQTLHTHQWEVTLAPNVDDVIWDNLSLSTVSKRVRWCIAQILFVILFCFISTPSIVIGFTKQLNSKTKWQDYLERIPLMKVFVGPLIFVILAALLPFLVLLISDVRGFSTHSRLNFYNYRRVFIFLFFMILVLPSIGLTNIQDLVEKFVNGVKSINYSCIFRPDNTAFFVNYIISAAMLGLMAELLRIADMLFYLILLILMKSKAERKYVKKQSILQFPYGYCYAFQLLAACVVIVYSPICPIIAPFGLIYSLMRHYVDRYNLYFSFEPSKLNQDIHKSSTVILLSAGFLSLVLLFIYSLIKADTESKLSNVNSVVLLILIIIVVCYWSVKKFVYMVSSVSHGVIETSNLIKKASEENILAAAGASAGSSYTNGTTTGVSGSSANAIASGQNPDTAYDSTNQSVNDITNEDFNGNYHRAESEPIIDVGGDGSSFLSTPNHKRKAATLDMAEHNADFSNALPLSTKKGKKGSQTSDFHLEPISDSQKFLPPIYHLLKCPEVSSKLTESYRPKDKSWFSQGPEKKLTGSLRGVGVKISKQTSSNRGHRTHRRSASDGGKLDPSASKRNKLSQDSQNKDK